MVACSSSVVALTRDGKPRKHGPLTEGKARSAGRVKYGSLTATEFDVLDCLSMLGPATYFEIMAHVGGAGWKNEGAACRYVYRMAQRHLVTADFDVDRQEGWAEPSKKKVRMTDVGEWVYARALEDMMTLDTTTTKRRRIA